MLNPVRRIGSQYVEYIRTHQKMTKKEAWARQFAYRMAAQYFYRYNKITRIMKFTPFPIKLAA